MFVCSRCGVDGRAKGDDGLELAKSADAACAVCVIPYVGCVDRRWTQRWVVFADGASSTLHRSCGATKKSAHDFCGHCLVCLRLFVYQGCVFSRQRFWQARGLAAAKTETRKDTPCLILFAGCALTSSLCCYQQLTPPHPYPTLCCVAVPFMVSCSEKKSEAGRVLSLLP